jgi:predicted RNA-binding protein with PUA-like domain
MIQALNDIVIALALHRLRRRRFNVIDEDRIGDYMVRYVLDCGGYKIDAVAQTDGTVRVCGPNNEAISEAFDPYGSRAESLWLAQTIKDRIKEQATEGHDGL